MNEFTDHGDTDVTKDDVTADITYDYKPVQWIMGLPDSILVKNSSSTVLRERRASYNDKGQLTGIQQYVGGSSADTSLTYDSYGNLETVTGPEDDNKQRRKL